MSTKKQKPTDNKQEAELKIRVGRAEVCGPANKALQAQKLVNRLIIICLILILIAPILKEIILHYLK